MPYSLPYHLPLNTSRNAMGKKEEIIIVYPSEPPLPNKDKKNDKG